MEFGRGMICFILVINYGTKGTKVKSDILFNFSNCGLYLI